MARGAISGYRLTATDASIVKGMLARGDRDHDIAAWFGVNQGRVADVKDGRKFSSAVVALGSQLPPKGAPGVKGRRLRGSVQSVLQKLQSGDAKAATAELAKALSIYDTNET